MTLEQIEQKIVDLGYTVMTSWEEAGVLYAASMESYGPDTYGHSKAEVRFSHDTGWLMWASPEDSGEINLYTELVQELNDKGG